MSHAIILAYHGPANYATEPFSWFPGNTILSSLGLSAYPTGIIDRTSGVQSRSAWVNLMNQRNNVPATVEIECTSRSYDPASRTFNATFDLTALQTLSGEYKYNVIITENGIIWQQNGSLGGPNYVHDWTVRSMVNGALGETVVNGTWNQGQTITMSINNYVLPVPSAPAPDIIPDSCELVCLVYKQGSPLSSGAEIQQAEKWVFVEPNYVAAISSPESDVLAGNTTLAQNSVVIHNMGLMSDTYYINLDFDGPAGWTQSFTTVNGTFPIGQVDSIEVAAGDSTEIMVEVNPNAISGFGKTTVHFASKNLPTMNGSITLRFATYGLGVLVVDDESGSNYEDYMTFELDKTALQYGVVSGSAVPAASANLNTFGAIIWMCADAVPTIDSDEMAALSTFLDNGGRLYLSGVDIAYELADPSSPYYTTSSLEFFNNYLHSDYVMRSPTNLHAYGVANDPISGGITHILLTGGTGAGTITSQKKANQIDAGDLNASTCFSYYGATAKYCGIRSFHPGTAGTGRVVFTTFGFETIADSLLRDVLAANILEWISTPNAIGDEGPGTIADRFELKANYPNPFNPSTTIAYTLPLAERDKNVSLVVFNQLGQKVKTLVNEIQPAGSHEVVWNGMDDAGNEVASGIYFYQLRYGGYQDTHKMLLVR